MIGRRTREVLMLASGLAKRTDLGKPMGREFLSALAEEAAAALREEETQDYSVCGTVFDSLDKSSSEAVDPNTPAPIPGRLSDRDRKFLLDIIKSGSIAAAAQAGRAVMVEVVGITNPSLVEARRIGWGMLTYAQQDEARRMAVAGLTDAQRHQAILTRGDESEPEAEQPAAAQP